MGDAAIVVGGDLAGLAARDWRLRTEPPLGENSCD